MDMDMQHGHGHAAWTLTRTTDLVMQHGPTVGMHGCMDAGILIKSSVRHRQFSVILQRSVWHLHSGIMVSPVQLVTD
jgi:hypothetical protein